MRSARLDASGLDRSCPQGGCRGRGESPDGPEFGKRESTADRSPEAELYNLLWLFGNSQTGTARERGPFVTPPNRGDYDASAYSASGATTSVVAGAGIGVPTRSAACACARIAVGDTP